MTRRVLGALTLTSAFQAAAGRGGFRRAQAGGSHAVPGGHSGCCLGCHRRPKRHLLGHLKARASGRAICLGGPQLVTAGM